MSAPQDQPDDVVVVGSANLDVVLSVDGIAQPGQTVLATGRATGPGGKGANQAAAAARSGARTTLIAAVGDDDGAAVLRAGLAAAGVGIERLRRSDRPTGTAYVVVDRRGENAIVVDLGANAALLELTADELDVVREARVLLCQLEVPVETVTAAAASARGLVVLNAAPARDLPEVLTAALDVLVVNEQEALHVGGGADLKDAVAALLVRVPEVVVTLGPAGALLARRDAPPVRVPGVPARQVVDTTGAGDVFCGALAAARARGEAPEDAARLACAAASLSVERPGAGTAAPSLEEARDRLVEAGRGGGPAAGPRRQRVTAVPEVLPFAHLVARAQDLASRGRRTLLGIAGAPGAGKSTLASALVGAVDGRAALVPLDGFHLDDAVLKALGRRDRKGAPDTFDAAGYVALLRRLRAAEDDVVYAPVFHREQEQAVAGALPVPRDVPLVVTEGNYLLAPGAFAAVRDLLDEVWFLDVDSALRRDRLVARHVHHGRTAEEAEAWVAGSDDANAELVEATRGHADLVVRLAP